ncbi:MlaA family lipoprotein [Pseudooctadecabacter jejudonensis]|uniref:Putative phospholipid-binding lipoprotein MlaA n=1 Tax=Pseudooctadecabacter jejudonensis TaxID=1391910 RepID=A0A1Y5S080_9RHOB|nr:VacJ family lipoprotein [Pseudooctadecabacter jejudonensis]SLN29774.1 putative phospholipid-binding lipoprotein MlaA precursor [Pseudooctadecabacter jejudonensis]
MAIGSVAACTTGDTSLTVNDPYEATNRQIHAFNKGLDQIALRPAGRVSGSIPDEYTQPITNFADNVGLPSAVANGLLQADIGGAATNTMRFLINTTVGIGGLFDPAGAIGLTEQKTDFGETLHVWGVGEGAYIELPLLGPSNQRDAVGELVDLLFDPLDQVGTAPQLDYGTFTRAADLGLTRGDLFDTIDGVLYDSADSYEQARLIALQRRRFELGQEAPADDAIDPFAGDLNLEGFE